MTDDRHDRIADLLKARLEALKARDGDLGNRRERWRGRVAGTPRPAGEAAPPPAVPPPSAASTTDGWILRAPGAEAPRPPQFGESFTPPPDGAASVGQRLRARGPVPLAGPDEAAAEALRRRWLEAHRGHGISEAVGGHRSPRHRDLIEAVELHTIRVETGDPFEVRQRLGRTLDLLPGVRSATAARLRDDGYADLEALAAHDRHGPAARRLVKRLREGDVAGLVERVGARLGRSSPEALALCAFLDPSDLLFLDIETMGLFGGSPIVVAGLASVTGGAVQVRQWVAASPDAEAALVRAVTDAAGECGALVTFNGRSFDWPYICGRAAFWGFPVRFEPAHFDLLPFSRRAWRGVASDCRLSTLAREVLGLHRAEDLPGALVPLFYQQYLEDPAARAGLLAAIAVHNRHDVVETVRLWGALRAWGASHG